ncbi:conjugal transfer protein TraK [Klebsiella pneumoniae]|uniref:TraK family protein n=1 Tax=Klebsiella pneumoniae TaxID=573 RepID=UPI001C7EE200|nr:TraK family protein [Klebsiella pneumoniae]MBX4558849.1 conjugal transfer protein TraK [Klebsiella pneumoniae]
MGKLTTEELGKWVQKKHRKKRKSSAIVEFLAVKSFVEEAVTAGYTLKDIWGYLKEGGQIRSTYETFRNHANRHIAPVLAAKKQTASLSDGSNEKSLQDCKNENQANNSPKKSKPTEIAGFKYNPKIDDKELF